MCRTACRVWVGAVPAQQMGQLTCTARRVIALRWAGYPLCQDGRRLAVAMVVDFLTSVGMHWREQPWKGFPRVFHGFCTGFQVGNGRTRRYLPGFCGAGFRRFPANSSSAERCPPRSAAPQTRAGAASKQRRPSIRGGGARQSGGERADGSCCCKALPANAGAPRRRRAVVCACSSTRRV